MTPESPDMSQFPNVPPIWTFAALAASYVADLLFPIAHFGGMPTSGLGALMFIGALALIVWCATFFRRKKTTIDPHQKPTTLIVEGPYKLSRNPIYLAMVIGTAGFALWLGSIGAFIPVVLLFIALHRLFVLPEEAGLIDTFGDEAKAYISKTRRWV